MILVTGGAGFIGSNIVSALSDRGTPVAVCDRLRQGDKWRNLLSSEIADVVPPESLEAWLDRHGSSLDAIVHMGAISSTTEPDVDLIVETNLRLSSTLWGWCAGTGTRFIYASSGATYGDGSEGFDDDTSADAMARLRPLNAYGWSKHTFDRRVLRAVREERVVPPQWAGLKFFNVYGPNEYHKGGMQSVVSQKYAAAAAGEPVTLFRSHRDDVEDGGQLRDFIFVDDCVKVVLWLLDNPDVSGIFNVGTGTARSFRELAEALIAAVGSSSPIQYIDTPEAIRPNYQYYTCARMERLREAGYDRPFTSLEDGVTAYVRNYLMQPCRYR